MQNNFHQFLTSTFILLVCFVSVINSQAKQQTITEVKIPIVQRSSSKYFNCYSKNKVLNEQEFKEILKNKKCSLAGLLKVDFTKHTLISYRVGGDCHMQADADVFRIDKTKLYKVILNNYWGRCRAGGSVDGFVVIDKIPTDYKVAFEVKLIEHLPWEKPKPFRRASVELIESSDENLKGCIPIYRGNQFVITSKASYLKSIRNDSQTEKCKALAENLDFEKYSYLGIEINSGHCRFPLGLEYKLLKYNFKKQYVLNVGYIKPYGICRALSRYDLWVKVPKLQKDFEVLFQVTAKPR